MIACVGRIVARLALAALALMGVAVVTFVLFRLLPEDAAAAAAGPDAPAATLADLRRSFGLDKPTFFDAAAARDGRWRDALDSQFVDHLRRVAAFDYGRSWATRRPVAVAIGEGLRITLALSVPVFVASSMLGILVGLLCAGGRGGAPVGGLFPATVVVTEVPSVVWLLFGQALLGFRLGWFPVHGFEGPGSLVLPLVLGTLVAAASHARYLAPLFASELATEHVRAARARGVGEMRLLTVHVLAGTAGPVATRLGGGLAHVVLGSAMLEIAFGIPGLGGLFADALAARDLPVVCALTVLGASGFLAGQLGSEALAALVDPRVRRR